MKRSIISLFAALIMIVQSVVPVFAVELKPDDMGQEQTEARDVQSGTYENFEYEIAEGEVTITNCEKSTKGDLVIPETIEGYPVTKIGEKAFVKCFYLNSVIMSSVREISTFAFSECISLVSVEMPNVQKINEYAFISCHSLPSIELPNAEEIASSAFEECVSLESVDMPNVKKVAGDSFLNTEWYDRLTDEFAVVGDGVLVKYCGKDTSVTVPDGIKCVAGFYGNNKIISVDIPNAQAIGDCGLYGCRNLKSVEMPNVESIGRNGFCLCDDLVSVYMPNVQEIDAGAFDMCWELVSVEFGNVQVMGNSAFSECESLISVYFHSDAPTKFGENVFERCAEGFMIYYAKGTQGWTTPTWNGYKTQEFDPNQSIGDLNGDGKVNTADAVVVLKAAAGMITLDGTQTYVGDCNADGTVNTADAVLILKYAAGIIPDFSL